MTIYCRVLGTVPFFINSSDANFFHGADIIILRSHLHSAAINILEQHRHHLSISRKRRNARDLLFQGSAKLVVPARYASFFLAHMCPHTSELYSFFHTILCLQIEPICHFENKKEARKGYARRILGHNIFLVAIYAFWRKNGIVV